MEFEATVIIDKPLAEVLNIFDNLENLRHWQRGLVSYEILNGLKGELGTKSLMTYKNGMKLTETVTVKDLPHEFSGIYEAKGVWNQVKNFFRETPEGKTEWKCVCEFRCTGFMKVLLWLFPGMARKQTTLMMEDFKAFAERGVSVPQ